MVKFRMTAPNGKTLYGLGIDAENVRRMEAGNPIMVNLEEIGGQGTVLIFYGENTQNLRELIQAGIGPQTVVHEQKDKNDGRS